MLLAQLARDADVPVAWIGLRPAHRDPRRLMAEIDEALSLAAPVAGSPVLLVLDDVDHIAAPERARGGVGLPRRPARRGRGSRSGAGPTPASSSAGGWWRAG